MEEHTPYPKRMKRKAYEAELRLLQIELLKVQSWANKTGERIVILFEGRDAAGKGGAIKRFTAYLNPRSARVVALPKPNDTERGQWYFQRYTAHLPTAGEMVFFDRSWYNRSGVESVMGFCTADDLILFARQAPEFERALVDNGIRLFKLWFSVSQEEQRRRFEARKTDPLKQWKLSPMDMESMQHFDDYSEARNGTMHFTDTRHAPWTIVNSNEKRRARINSIRHVLAALPYENKDRDVAKPPDPHVVRPVSDLHVPVPTGFQVAR